MSPSYNNNNFVDYQAVLVGLILEDVPRESCNETIASPLSTVCVSGKILFTTLF